MNDQQKRALQLAGTMADAAVALVGGRSLNGTIGLPPIEKFSHYAMCLREAVEAYNDHILSMEKNK
jgi:hypothetical protein